MRPSTRCENPRTTSRELQSRGATLVVVLGLVVGLLLVGAVLRLLVPRMRRLLV